MPPFAPPPLGVGMVYFPALAPFLAGCGVVQVLEVEPQTLWLRAGPQAARQGGGHRLDERAFEALERLPQPKLVHGVGMPLAATVPPDARQQAPWQDTLARLRPPWVSEHLAFQRVPLGEDGGARPGSRAGQADQADEGDGAPGRHGGFLLPALQCEETVAFAARRIAALRALSGLPVAFENSPNYLQPRPGELPDGEFLARVARAADCGILLDLHNLWCNERNGRQTMREAMQSLPLERVWEIHLAGGEAMDGYWLDAHSGLVPPQVMAFCEEWLPRLPNLGAMVFEVIPDYVRARGLTEAQLAGQLEAMQALWHRRGVAPPAGARGGFVAAVAAGDVMRAAPSSPAETGTVASVLPSAAAWEQALGALVNGRGGGGLAEGAGLAADPGVAVMRQLVESFRAGTLAEGLTLSWRLLVLTLGEPATAALMARFWRARWPQPFAADEMRAFADFLRGELAAGTLDVPHLGSVLDYELLRARLQASGAPPDHSPDHSPDHPPEGPETPQAANALPPPQERRQQPQWVRFGCDPLVLLGALVRGEAPGPLAPGEFELQVGP